MSATAGEGSLDDQVAIWNEGASSGTYKLYAPEVPQIETQELSEASLRASPAATTTAAAARPAAPAPEHLRPGGRVAAARATSFSSFTAVIERPRIKAHLDVVSVDGDKLFLLDGGKHFLLEGRAAAELGPLLDGTRELADLIADSGGGLPLPEVLRMLGTLDRLGFLADGPAGEDAPAAAYWDAAAIAPAAGARASSSSSSCTSRARCRTRNRSRPRSAARGSGSPTAASSPSSSPTTTSRPSSARLNRRLHDEGRQWVLAKLTGTELWLGPHVRPGESACWVCLEQRLAGNRQLARYLASKNGRAIVVPGAGAALAKYAPGRRGPRRDRGGGDPRHRPLDAARGGARHGRPPLARVGAPPRRPPAALPGLRRPRPRGAARPARELMPRPKHFTSDGGHRIERPEQTYERLAKHVSPITGAVSSLKRQTMEDNGVAYSYSSGHNFALMQDSLYFLRRNLRGRSGGKGRTEVQAKVGAICEAIERFSGVWRGDEPRLRAP